MVYKDLRQIADNSGDAGFIIFSLGSFFPDEAFPENLVNHFVEAFAKLHQKIIWKWNGKIPSSLPSNVKIVKWIPQQDLLGNLL